MDVCDYLTCAQHIELRGSVALTKIVDGLCQTRITLMKAWPRISSGGEGRHAKRKRWAYAPQRRRRDFVHHGKTHKYTPVMAITSINNC